MGHKTLLLAGLLGLTTTANAQASSAQQAAERDLFAKIVEIPTVEGQPAEFKKLTRLLTSEFRKAGITNVIVKDHDNTQTLIARWPAAKPSGKKPILLMAHMDVVAAKASDWKYPPFKFREEGGYYLGRGSNDNKAALTGIVLALQYLHAEKFAPARDIIVLFTGDEETIGNGARRAASEWRGLIDAEYALNGDAGGGSVFPDGRVEGFGIQIAEKTYTDFRLTAVNRGGHSSVPRPDNAIYALSAALSGIGAYEFPIRMSEITRATFTALGKMTPAPMGPAMLRLVANPDDAEANAIVSEDPRFHSMLRTTCVATQIEGGHAINALPQRAFANINCRMFPTDSPEEVGAALRKAVGDAPVTVTAVPPVNPKNPPPPLKGEVYDKAAALAKVHFPGVPIVPSMSTGATDARFLIAAGVPTYGVPGLLSDGTSNAHGLNERTSVKWLMTGRDYLHDLVKAYAGVK
jgi:acetylornithine deacetylase/succinyl-diaminopimelate desuccinylase-like protein